MIDGGCNKVSLKSRAWNRMLLLNEQPSFINAEFEEQAQDFVCENEKKVNDSMEKIKTRVQQ